MKLSRDFKKRGDKKGDVKMENNNKTTIKYAEKTTYNHECLFTPPSYCSNVVIRAFYTEVINGKEYEWTWYYGKVYCNLGNKLKDFELGYQALEYDTPIELEKIDFKGWAKKAAEEIKVSQGDFS